MRSHVFRAPGLPRTCRRVGAFHVLAVAVILGLGGGPTALTAEPSSADKPARPAGADPGWFPFAPGSDAFTESPIDLRFLNEKFAGEHGLIAARDGRFVHSANGEPVRFWAVNGPSHDASDPTALRRTARLLAKYGVNLVRRHGAVFDKDGELNPESVERTHAIVEAMKAEGIYTHLSIYFPLWFTPRADHPWLQGYNGKSHPFAALMFNPEFQEKYRGWWKALLTTPGGASGRALVDEPALFGVEMQNEDSFFFWTFDAKNLPEPQLRILERRFGDWLSTRYGSIEAAQAAWKGLKLERDTPAEGRMAFRPLWNMFNDKTPRDQATVEFLWELQTTFYRETIAYLRGLGFKGLITASNWATASPEVFGPLEKLSYAVGDFIDRHGYFECNHKGDNAAWSVREGHTYSDRSALRFEASDPTKPRQFVHPVMDPQYAGKPSMISETTFCRPNRHRSEAPLYFAAYGALQDSDAIVHFAFDGSRWAVKPGFWMQQWTLMTPAMMGQFPATALIYRRGLISPGAVLTDLKLNLADLLKLKGTPLPQDAALDELRLADVPQGTEVKPGQRLDPLVHYAGRVEVSFTDENGSINTSDLARWINHEQKLVVSSTGELKLDYGRGVLTLNAPRAQGISGALKAAGRVELSDLTIESGLEVGHVVVVALDDKPLATSERMLLQVMSEERETGRRTEPAGDRGFRIVNLGRDPWEVRALSGSVQFTRKDARQLTVTALDLNGYPQNALGTADQIRLQPATLYYWITAATGDPRK